MMDKRSFWRWYVGLLKPRKIRLDKADKYYLTIVAGASLLALVIMLPLLVSPWCAFGLPIPVTVLAYAYWGLRC